MTLGDVSAKTGYKVARIGHWLTGRRKANGEEIEEIARALKVPTARLFTDDPVMGASERGKKLLVLFEGADDDAKSKLFQVANVIAQPKDGPGRKTGND